MTKILTASLATIAMLALATAADAGSRHKHGKKHMKHMQQSQQHPGWQQNGYWSSYGYGFKGDRYDYSQRRDASTWTGPMNAWDKARRDDALLSDHW